MKLNDSDELKTKATEIALAIDQQLVRLGAKSEIRDLVRVAREKGQAVKPDHIGRDNVIVASNLPKSGRRVELSSLYHEQAAWTYESESDVLAAHYMPTKTELFTCDAKGIVRSRDPYVPMFLVVRLDKLPRFEDWKLVSAFSNVSRGSAARYVPDHSREGAWIDRTASKWAESLGAEHRIRMQGEIKHNVVVNVKFLRDYSGRHVSPLSQEKRIMLQRSVSHGDATFRDLLRLKFTADEIFYGIVDGTLVVDMEEQLLAESDSLRLFRSTQQMLFYREVREAERRDHPIELPAVDGIRVDDQLVYLGMTWRVKVVTPGRGLICRNDGSEETLPSSTLRRLVEENLRRTGAEVEIARRRNLTWADLNDKQQAAALRNAKALQNGGEGLAKRTFYRLRAQCKDAKNTLERLVALAPRHDKKGRYGSHFADPRTLELAKEVIATKYNNPDRIPIARLFEFYCERCIQEEVAPMSVESLGKLARKLENVEAREGKRVAHIRSDIPLQLDVHEPLSGCYPHEVVYADHTQLPLFTVGPHGEKWDKVWLSVIVDGHTTQTRALYVSYRPPSTHSSLMLFRDYVRRHNRVPRVMVLDGGKDLGAREVADLCKVLDIDCRFRASGKPRGGNRVENLFSVTENEFIAGLEGNSIAMHDGTREMTAAVDPRKRRVWQFTELSRAIDNYLMVKRPSEVIHPVLGVPPAEFERQRIWETGHRNEDPITLDSTLMLLTSTYPDRPTRLVRAHLGVWDSGSYYWDPRLADYVGQSLEVRLEPWYAGVLYVKTKRGWIPAVSRDRTRWARTAYEVQYAWQQRRLAAKRAAQFDRRSPERAAIRAERLDRRFFSDPLHIQEQIERIYWRAAMEIATAFPLSEEVASAQHENQPIPEELGDAQSALNVEGRADADVDGVTDVDFHDVDEAESEEACNEAYSGDVDWTADERSGLI